MIERAEDDTVIYVFCKVDEYGYWYADLHTKLVARNTKIADGWGNLLTVHRIEEFSVRTQAGARMLKLRLAYKKSNLAKNPEFIARGDRNSRYLPNGRVKSNRLALEATRKAIFSP